VVYLLHQHIYIFRQKYKINKNTKDVSENRDMYNNYLIIIGHSMFWCYSGISMYT